MRDQSFLAALLLAGLAVACGGGDADAEDGGGGRDAASGSDAKVDASDASGGASDAREEASDASEEASDASEEASDASDGGDARVDCVVGSVVCEGDILVKCPGGERVETDCAAIGRRCHASMGHCM